MSTHDLDERQSEIAESAAREFISSPEVGSDGPTVLQREAGFSERLRGTYLKIVSTSWLMSALLHLTALVLIGKIFLPLLPPPPVRELVIGEPNEPMESLEEFRELSIETNTNQMAAASSVLPLQSNLFIEEPELSLPVKEPVSSPAESMMTLADTFTEFSAPVSAANNAGSGRSSMTASALRHAGGNAMSEGAVKESLAWLVAHQLPDGGWSLQNGQVQGCKCRDSGYKTNEQTQKPERYEARFGATGLALLPFLGSGRTHLRGEYQRQVRDGLSFLINSMKRDGDRASLRDRGNYYSHGICTIAVCEAYTMTNDPSLREPAQALINEIIYGQDPVGGGWRYTPKMPGDTSVTGWQFMAHEKRQDGWPDRAGPCC